MYQTLLIIYLVIAIAVITLILLQQGRGADAGASFGASNTVFGSAGSANFLSRLTAILATAFFVISILIGNINAHRNNIQQGKFDDLSQAAEQLQKQVAPAIENKNADIPQ